MRCSTSFRGSGSRGGAWSDVASDLENRVVVLTGRDENFFGDIESGGFADLTTREGWDTIYREGRAFLRNLANIPMPVIAAVNGPAKAHGDIALLADLVVA